MTMMCGCYFVRCVVDEDDCGVCGQPQGECGYAVEWDVFAKICPNHHDPSSECKHVHIGIYAQNHKCAKCACPKIRITDKQFDSITFEVQM